jgi:hypothetical protein
MGWRGTGLTEEQGAFVERVVPDVEVLADDSWGLLDTQVLHVRGRDGERTVKACGPDNTHFPRELHAHRHWTAGLVRTGHTSALLAVDEGLRVLVLDRVPGHLALGRPAASDPDVHRQAGVVLRRLHDQHGERDDAHADREHRKALAALDRPHRIATEAADRARALLTEPDDAPVTVVPTHGDWHPRNWIVDHGRLAAIDFGRAALRPPTSDLTRLAVLHWADDPGLEQAFLAGYGRDPRAEDPAAWRRLQLREAVGTAVWAHLVGDVTFEAQGLRMLDDALAAFDAP